SSVGSATSTHTRAPCSSMRSLTRVGSKDSSFRTPSLYRRQVITAGERLAQRRARRLRDVPGFDALVRLFAALDGLLERCEPAPWGAIVTDARLPRIYDANYARVDGTTDVSLAEVEGLLLPELERSGARFAHVRALDPEA